MDEARENQAALAQGKAFVWHELDTADQSASIEFYTTALDFGTIDMEMGEMGTYRMLTRNGSPVCGVTTSKEVGAGDTHSNWATYVSVDNVDARLEICLALGAKLINPAHDVPTVGRMALITDPQGAYVWLFQSE